MWLPSGDMNKENLHIAEPCYKQGIGIYCNEYIGTKKEYLTMAR